MKKKILIIDDEKELLTALGERLTAVGYDVMQADNARDGIIMAKSLPPDLIILDVLMPVMDGSTAANILKYEPETQDIPIIFLTALATPIEEESVGKNCYVAKPYDSNKLLEIIKEKTA